MSWTPTALGDVLQRTPFSDYIAAFLPNATAYAQAGIAGTDMSQLISSGGSTAQIRKFLVDSTAPVLDDGTASDGAALSSYTDVCVVTRRKRVRGVDNQTIAALGSDVVGNEIMQESPYYWGNCLDSSLSAVLLGVLNTTNGVLRATHVKDISIPSGTVTPVTFNNFIDAAKLQGDKLASIRSMVVHPLVWADMVKESAAKALAVPAQMGGDLLLAGTYGPWKVYLSDRATTSGSSTYKKYYSFMFRPGALGLLWQKDVQTASQYDAY